MSRPNIRAIVLASVASLTGGACNDHDVTGSESLNATSAVGAHADIAHVDALASVDPFCLAALHQLATVPSERIEATTELEQIALQTLRACTD